MSALCWVSNTHKEAGRENAAPFDEISRRYSTVRGDVLLWVFLCHECLLSEPTRFMPRISFFRDLMNMSTNYRYVLQNRHRAGQPT